MAQGIETRLQTELEQFQTVQRDLQKYVTMRQKLDAQLNENTLVKGELELVEAEAKVYKLVGPVLVKQELTEAHATVQKRIDYINGELKRYDSLIKNMEKKSDSQTNTLNKLQQQFQQMQIKAAAATKA
ncbi:hypothetical protein ACOMHN_007319 [Nucella lapillus]